MANEIANRLGVDPAPIVEVLSASPLTTVAERADDTRNSNATNDYEYARTNLMDLAEKGAQALEDMLDFAKQSQHPRAYEVVATLISQLTATNKELLTLSKTIKDITKVEKAAQELNPEGGGANNQVFFGSTADMQKMLRDLRAGAEVNE